MSSVSLSAVGPFSRTASQEVSVTPRPRQGGPRPSPGEDSVEARALWVPPQEGRPPTPPSLWPRLQKLQLPPPPAPPPQEDLGCCSGTAPIQPTSCRCYYNFILTSLGR
ncbi:palladin-like isoform X2 [Erinaceus europaeus]|uniref:Palladin-like isoform X2 n=1 Tax=Erinaceus europaeus TaxID=9365 RepID=A0ABM3VUF9_ERIEU|nr:palladin-like isoform X2 [Erinaceus europaeus]